MKKLLIITKSLSLDDGLGRYSMGLIKNLMYVYELIILSSDISGPGAEYLKKQNIKYYKIAPVKRFFNLSYNFLYSLKLYKFFRKADFIHSFSDYPQCLLPFWMPFFKTPIFVTIHGTYGVQPLNNFISGFFLKMVYKRSKKVFCVSDFTKKEILKRVNIKNAVVINNGVDYEKFQKNDLMHLPQQKNINTKTILGVGVLKQRKGYHISIRAIGELKKSYSGIKYYIVGNQEDKNYFNLLKNLVKNYNIEQSVVFLEKISEESLIDLYYQSDLFLLTSISVDDTFEGFGQVYLEAGACGVPVIGTLNCGAEDAIADGITGLLIPQNDIQATVDAVSKLLDNPGLTQKMGENGRKRAREMSWNNAAKKYIKYYENK